MNIISGHSNKVRVLADSTAENIHQLKGIIPHLAINEGELIRKLENAVIKDEIKGIIVTVKNAIGLWETTMGNNSLDLDVETEAIKQFGYKHARQIELGKFLDEAQLPNVKMPKIYGLSDSLIQEFLEKHAPSIKTEWKELNRIFTGSLENEEIKKRLEKIQEAISLAFQDDFPFSEEFLTWLESGDYLMVRSSGTEDTRKTANAGGNESVAYVKPNKIDVCKAIGKVVKSYFSFGSLKNRVNANENPFSSLNRLSVSISQLIGEQIGGSPEEIPASVVLFTNEPTYVGKEPFRIMRISTSYGHGEGVVGSVGIKSDTIMILQSVKYPDRLYIIEDNYIKRKRLAPVEKNGKIRLEKIENSFEMAHRPTLSKEMLTRLFYLGVAVEKHYNGIPMDMELVVKNDIIYPVQARPVNRQDAIPTYVDMRKIKEPYVNTEMVLPGAAEVLKNLKPSEIVISDTLANAEQIFNQGTHRLVIISIPEESKNSHPIVNFSSMNIPCFYIEDISKIKELLKTSDTFLACTQTGTLISSSRHECIQSGYTVHPAKVAVSVVPRVVPKVPFRKSVDLVSKELLRRIASHEIALEAINKLKEPHRNSHTYVSDSNFEQIAHAATEVYLRAISEYKAVQPNQRLHKLFYAKVIENLSTQNPPSESLGHLSTQDIKYYREAAERIKSYQNQFQFPTRFHEQIILSDYMMTTAQKDVWMEFMISLENNRDLQPEKVEKFKKLLSTLENLGLMSMWMVRFFLPETEKNIDKFNELLNTEAESQLLEISKINNEIATYQDNVAAFPKIDFNKILSSSNPLVRIYAIAVFEAVVDMYDKGIKKLKMNPEIDHSTKVKLFHDLLETFFQILSEGVLNFADKYEKCGLRMPIDSYLNELHRCLKQSSNSPSTLFPSRRFNVAASILGAATDFARGLPETKEDVFTLIHQNLLFFLQLLLGDEMDNKTEVPPLVKQVMNAMVEPLELTGFHFPPGKMILTYNYPLRNHSAVAEVHFDQETQKCSLHVRFLGEARNRWSAINTMLNESVTAGLFTLTSTPKANAMQISYGIELTPDTINTAVSELRAYGRLSLLTETNAKFYAEDFIKRLQSYKGEEYLESYLKKLARSNSQDVQRDITYALFAECEKRSSDPMQATWIEETIRTVFSFPILKEMQFDYRRAGEIKKILEDFTAKFSNSNAIEDKLACIMISLFSLSAKVTEENFKKFISIRSEDIPEPARWFLYRKFLEAGYSFPQIGKEFTEASMKYPHCIKALVEFIKNASFIDLQDGLKAVNSDDLYTIIEPLLKKISLTSINVEDFIILKEFYTKHRLGSIALACHRQGSRDNTLEFALDSFDSLDMPHQIYFWHKTDKTKLSVKNALNIAQYAAIDEIFLESIKIVVESSQEPIQDIFFTERNDFNSLFRSPENFLPFFKMRDDLLEVFYRATTEKLVVENPKFIDSLWWFRVLVHSVKVLPIDRIKDFLKKVVCTEDYCKQFFDALSETNCDPEVLREIYAEALKSDSKTVREQVGIFAMKLYQKGHKNCLNDAAKVFRDLPEDFNSLYVQGLLTRE